MTKPKKTTAKAVATPTEQVAAETPAADTVEQLSCITVLKAFSASENGCTVNDYPAGQYAYLPAVAAAHAISIGAVSEEDAVALLTALQATEANQGAE